MPQRDLFPDEPPSPPILSVYELTVQIKDLLENSFPAVWVSGEISNLSRPQSGHCYLTLKDDRAQIRAAIWRNVAARVRFDLADGLEVICQGHLDVYAPRGSYQLIVDQIEPKGMGALELALRQLREKLAREGLFDPARKRPLPRLVRRVGLVTSPTGAAIHDFLQVLGRRWRGADVLVLPTRVQGEGAAEEIAAAIGTANRLPLADRLPGGRPRRRQPGRPLGVQRRGGGPRHLRLADPGRLGHRPRDRRDAFRPGGRRARADAQRGGRTGGAGGRGVDCPACGRSSSGRRRRCGCGWRRPGRGWMRSPGIAVFRRPLQRIEELARRLDELEAAAARAVRSRLERAGRQLDAAAARLESLSPLAVLGRGYSLTQRTADGRLIRDAAELAVGEQITTAAYARGQATSRVEETKS